MDKESIVDVLTADTDVFFACWDTDNGWQVLTNGNASFPAALFAQKGIEALRDVVAESDSRLCDNFLQEIDRGVESHNNEDVIKGNCRTVHMHILDMQGECIYYRLKCNFMKRDDGSIEKIVFQARELDAEEKYRIHLAQSVTNDRNPNVFTQDVIKLMRKHQKCKFALIQLDVERFKVINEMYGEDFGDDLLKCFENTLKYICNEMQLYVRLTADVFMIATPYETKEDILAFVSMLEQRLSGYENVKYTLAFGVCFVTDINTNLRLYGDGAALARQSIKGDALHKVAFYHESMRTDARKRKFLEDAMHQALENHEFVMYLQPKYSISTCKMVGAEALVRWQHPEKGLIPPNDFIPIFEENGFVIPLDEFMWEEACKLLAEWQREGKEMLPISVNVSRRHLIDDYFVEVLNHLIEKYQIPKHYLEIEITETEQSKMQERGIALLKENGYTLLMDDFGSGYSTLNMLKDTQFDVIKIDRVFLQNFIASDRGQKIVEHTIKMSQDIGLGMVAEGVETKEQAEFLSNCGCDIAQGFYYAKPMCVADFKQLQLGKAR